MSAPRVSGTLQPWKALGRKWHLLGKGFPAGSTPDWPLELADRMLKLLEQLAGKETLCFEAADRVEVRPNGFDATWVEVETKTPESLKLTLFGPGDAFDSERLENLDVEETVEHTEDARSRVTLHLTELKQARSRKLRYFLKEHLEKSVKCGSAQA